MKPIVEVEEITKMYRLGQIGATSFHESLQRWLGKFRGRPDRALDIQRASRMGEDPNTYWALKGVSFTAQQGKVVGLVGRNGAGKSTLLKILSRITEPTSGRAVLRGRVGSLLEVGTGFHPELSGRDNIFLNGAILGMRRREIARKFDEIVEFSEIGAFLDTPVKRYSSGMYVRLAFAVAAHLEPEILLIDEVLAVGDAAFQKKCLGKMGEVANQGGRTVFFVSHNMGAVRSLCDEAVLIEGGKVAGSGDPGTVINQYFALALAETGQEGMIEWSEAEAPQNNRMALRAVRLRDEAGRIASSFQSDVPFTAEIEYDLRESFRGARWNLSLLTQDGEIAFTATDHIYQPENVRVGRYRTSCRIPGGLLNRRRYIVSVRADLPGEFDIIPTKEVLSLTISGAGNQASTFPDPSWPGVVCPKIAWEVTQIDDRPSAV